MRCALPRLFSLAALTLVAGCGWPRDPDHTGDHIAQTKVLRVGVSENPPWITLEGGQVGGIEAGMVRAVAADMGARVEWVPGGEGALMKELKARRLDLLAAGVTADNPW